LCLQPWFPTTENQITQQKSIGFLLFLSLNRFFKVFEVMRAERLKEPEPAVF
jgi:hypothetical protein